MNAKDRKVMEKVYDAVNTITGMTPNNPADWKAIRAYHAAIVKAGRPLLMALSELNYGEYENAHEFADDALALLAARPGDGGGGTR